MKKISLLFLTGSCVFVFGNGNVLAQNAAGQSIITGGVGFSLVGMLFSTIKNAADDVPGSSIDLKSTPGMQLNYDYGVADKFSLGAAFSYQHFKIVYNNVEWSDDNGFTDTSSWDDKISRMNIGVRPLFHFGNNERLDLYTGARISFTRWAASTTNRDSRYDFADSWGNSFSNRVRFQALFGMRYYFIPNLGFNTEFAIGTPYFMMMGINYRFPAGS